jgi:hypothetical protein
MDVIGEIFYSVKVYLVNKYDVNIYSFSHDG